jgi:hypothetical protein
MDWMDCLMLFLQEKQRQDAMPQLLPTLLIYWVRKELGIWLNLQLNSADHLVEGPDFMLLARQIMRSDSGNNLYQTSMSTHLCCLAP